MSRAVKIVLAFAALLFLYLVWPTPYRYFESPQRGVYLVRVNRLTQAAAVALADGWTALEPPKPRTAADSLGLPDPYDFEGGRR